MYRVELSQHLQRHLLDQRLNTAPQKLRLLQLPLATENINKGNFLALFSTRHKNSQYSWSSWFQIPSHGKFVKMIS